MKPPPKLNEVSLQLVSAFKHKIRFEQFVFRLLHSQPFIHAPGAGVMSVHVKTQPTDILPFFRASLHKLEQRPENSATAKSLLYIHALYPPEISVPPIAPFVSDKQLAYYRAYAVDRAFGDEVSSLGWVVQKRRHSLRNPIEVELPMFSFKRQSHVEFGNNGDVGLAGLSDVDVDARL